MSPSDLNLCREVIIELARARSKFRPFTSGHEAYAVILEEVDELWTEVRSNQKTAGRQERMRKEAIQIAAMALRLIIDMGGFSA